MQHRPRKSAELFFCRLLQSPTRWQAGDLIAMEQLVPTAVSCRRFLEACYLQSDDGCCVSHVPLCMSGRLVRIFVDPQQTLLSVWPRANPGLAASTASHPPTAAHTGVPPASVQFVCAAAPLRMSLASQIRARHERRPVVKGVPSRLHPLSWNSHWIRQESTPRGRARLRSPPFQVPRGYDSSLVTVLSRCRFTVSANAFVSIVES